MKAKESDTEVYPGHLLIHQGHPFYDTIKDNWKNWKDLHVREFMALTPGGNELFEGTCKMTQQVNEYLKFELGEDCNDEGAFRELLQRLEEKGKSLAKG